MCDVAVVCSDGYLCAIQQPKSDSRAETLEIKTLIEAEFWSQAGAVRDDELHIPAAVSQRLVSVCWTSCTFPDDGIPESDIDISDDDGGVVQSFEIALDFVNARHVLRQEENRRLTCAMSRC